jgi:hypothetical protein
MSGPKPVTDDDEHPTLEEAQETLRKFAESDETRRQRAEAIKQVPLNQLTGDFCGFNTFERGVELERRFGQAPKKELFGAPAAPSSAPTAAHAYPSDLVYNERFAVITDMGRTQVYWIHPNGRAVPYLTTADFFGAWAHETITISSEAPGGEKRERSVEAAKHWFYKFPDRRTYHFAIFVPKEDAPPNTYNFWPGFGIKPIQGDCHLSLAYLKDLLCGGIDEEYQWLRKWCSHMFQRPWEKPETSIVIPGEEEGTGKSFFTKILSVLIDGKDEEPYLFFSTSNAKLVSGDFTGHLRHCLLLHSEEALKPDSEKENSIIKNLITESNFGFHAKFKDAKAAKNFIRLIFTGNQPHIVSASRTSRRYFVPSVSTEKMQDHAYFKALQYELDNGGYEALMYEFMNTDISEYDVRSAPITAGLLAQRSESHKGAEAFWIDILQTGQLSMDETSLNRYYPSMDSCYHCEVEAVVIGAYGSATTIKTKVNEYHIVKHKIFSKFNKFEGRSPYRDKSRETQFGIQFCKFFPKISTFTLRSDKNGKFNYYILPPLTVARQCMDHYLGYKYKWDVTITEWGDEPYA